MSKSPSNTSDNQATELAPVVIGRSREVPILQLARPVYLRGVFGHYENRVFEIYTKTVSIGRSPYNDIVLQSSSVSSRHAVLSTVDGAWSIKDLDSSNGTYVNGDRIVQGQLLDGDDLLLGEEEFVFNPAANAERPSNLEIKPLRLLKALAVGVVVLVLTLLGYYLVSGF